jgi:U3 small nucleolar RNA-associated protein 14
MKKPEKVEKWKEIRVSNAEPPTIEGRTEKDEEKMLALSNKDVDTSETFLARFEALQKRNAVAAVLDMKDDE